MAAPLAVSAIMGILRFAASKGVQEAIKKYGRSVYNEALGAATKAGKQGEQIRSQLNRLGKEAKAGLPAKIRNALPSATSSAGRSTSVRGGRSKEAARAGAREGEFIPKDKSPSTSGGGGGRRGTTVEGSTGGGSAGGRAGSGGRRAAGAGVAAGVAATSVGDGESKPKSSSRSGGGSYTVKSGDTMSAIAKRSGVRLSELRDANPQIKDLNKIKPGQKLKVPGASIKGSGKSIYEGMSKSEMESMAKRNRSRKGRGGRDVSSKDEADTLAMLREEKVRRQNKQKVGMATGGMVKANCGASMKPNRKAKS